MWRGWGIALFAVIEESGDAFPICHSERGKYALWTKIEIMSKSPNIRKCPKQPTMHSGRPSTDHTPDCGPPPHPPPRRCTLRGGGSPWAGSRHRSGAAGHRWWGRGRSPPPSTILIHSTPHPPSPSPHTIVWDGDGDGPGTWDGKAPGGSRGGGALAPRERPRPGSFAFRWATFRCPPPRASARPLGRGGRVWTLGTRHAGSGALGKRGVCEFGHNLHKKIENFVND